MSCLLGSFSLRHLGRVYIARLVRSDIGREHLEFRAAGGPKLVLYRTDPERDETTEPFWSPRGLRLSPLERAVVAACGEA
jgi:hypothetical protein